MEYFKAKDYFRALEEFNSATSLEFEDKKRKRTYGTRFIKYLPHSYMGQCYFYLGEADNARREFELSIAYVKNKTTKKFLEKITAGDVPQARVVTFVDKKEDPEQQQKEKDLRQRMEELKRREAELERLVKERKKREEIEEELKQQEELKRKIEEERRLKEELEHQIEEEQKRRGIEGLLANQGGQLPAGALTYDPSRVTRVGSRLTVAVMPFHVSGGQDMREHITETMITQLVKLRRFRILERNALQKIMKEHSLSVSGVMEEATAIELGKLASADAIILGSVIISAGYSKINARVIDTETTVTIIAQDSETKNDRLENITEEVKRLAIKIYNDMPLVEGYVVSVDGEQVYIDLGMEAGIRRGTKVVVFREGNPIIHPVTGEELCKKKIQTGEMIIVQAHDKFSVARILNREEPINAGDRFVVK